MLEYDKIDISEGFHADKNKESCRCIICNYYDLLKVNIRFQNMCKIG